MKDFALLILRLTVGSLMAGHGAQKLFGWFGGHGLAGTEGWLSSMGFRPSRPWAIAAGASEFGGGLLTALGFLNPFGPLGIISSMGMATFKAHWGKPIWVTSGGAELPVVNIATALALGLVGPGKFSLDSLFGTRLPYRTVLVPGLALAAAGVAAGIMITNQPEAQTQEQPQPEEHRPEAVRVAAQPAEQANEQTQEQEAPTEAAGAELQAGTEAAHEL